MPFVVSSAGPSSWLEGFGGILVGAAATLLLVIVVLAFFRLAVFAFTGRF